MLTSWCHDFVSGFPGTFGEAGWSPDTVSNLLQVTWVSPYTHTTLETLVPQVTSTEPKTYAEPSKQRL